MRGGRAARGRDRGACRCREAVAGASGASGGTYGHGRITARADAGSEPGGRVGGRAAHGITGGEGLVARVARRRRRHGSHGGEVPEAPPSPPRDERGRHDLGADAPNEKWVTDVTESRIPAGKACLSPIADCFDGMPPGWAVPTSPDAEMADSSLLGACEWLREGDRTAARPDGGSHYRWPGWIGICEADGLVRSMSRKGCSPDNARCEGFFGRLKIEFFYGCDWSGVTIDELVRMLDAYLRWHGDAGTRSDPGHGSPTRHGRDLGSAARTWAS